MAVIFTASIRSCRVTVAMHHRVAVGAASAGYRSLALQTRLTGASRPDDTRNRAESTSGTGYLQTYIEVTPRIVVMSVGGVGADPALC